MLSNDDLNKCNTFLKEFSIWLINFENKPPVIEDLNEKGWFLFIAAPQLLAEIRQNRIEQENIGFFPCSVETTFE